MRKRKKRNTVRTCATPPPHRKNRQDGERSGKTAGQKRRMKEEGEGTGKERGRRRERLQKGPRIQKIDTFWANSKGKSGFSCCIWPR